MNIAFPQNLRPCPCYRPPHCDTSPTSTIGQVRGLHGGRDVRDVCGEVRARHHVPGGGLPDVRHAARVERRHGEQHQHSGRVVIYSCPCFETSAADVMCS